MTLILFALVAIGFFLGRFASIGVTFSIGVGLIALLAFFFAISPRFYLQTAEESTNFVALLGSIRLEDVLTYHFGSLVLFASVLVLAAFGVGSLVGRLVRDARRTAK